MSSTNQVKNISSREWLFAFDARRAAGESVEDARNNSFKDVAGIELADYIPAFRKQRDAANKITLAAIHEKCAIQADKERAYYERTGRSLPPVRA